MKHRTPLFGRASRVLSPRSRLQGTGSYPLPPQGWHFASRFTESHSPFRGPYLRSASRAYCEQVGVKRQEGGVRGEMQSW